MDSAAYWQLLSASLQQGAALAQPLCTALAAVCLQHWSRCLRACCTPDSVEAIQQVLGTAMAKAPDAAAIRQDILEALLGLWCGSRGLQAASSMLMPADFVCMLRKHWPAVHDAHGACER